MIYTIAFTVPENMLIQVDKNHQLMLDWNIFSVEAVKEKSSGRAIRHIAFISTHDFKKAVKIENSLKKMGISYYTRSNK